MTMFFKVCSFIPIPDRGYAAVAFWRARINGEVGMGEVGRAGWQEIKKGIQSGSIEVAR